MKNKHLFTFEEAMTLLNVGVYNFNFRNSYGDVFKVTLDTNNDRPKIETVLETTNE